MTAALIGHTGFVGSNLLRQRTFEARYNSSNVNDIRGREFDLVVCSGARAEKWRANAEPERDREHIDSLIDVLLHVRARKVVLISTVDVFKSPIAVDEDSPTPTDDLHAYGRNRRRLEEFVSREFDACVIRLAGLYGHGIKKNVIYDFLNDNDVDKIDSRGVFQFYSLDRLSHDIDTAIERRIPLVHLPAEPVSVAEVARAAFARDFHNEVVASPARYDIQTRYAAEFGGSGRYLEDKARELAGIAAFVQQERAVAQ
jgi:nucleoside-diphosphate-sugar epimerase